MSKAYNLQLMTTLITLEELQQHSDNPEKYDETINKIKNILTITTAGPPQGNRLRGDLRSTLRSTLGSDRGWIL